MLWPIGINVMVGDSFCGRWPRDSWGHTLAAPRATEKLRGATGSRQAAHGSVSGVDSRWGGNPRHSYLGGVLVGNGPRRGYWRARVVPGGETGVFVGFSLHVCGNGLWESTSVCSPGFP